MNESLRYGKTLTGWGRTAPSHSTVIEPHRTQQIASLVTDAKSGRGVIGRGLGRSYGDAAQNAGGAVVSSAALDRVLEFDTEAGTVRVEPGVSIESLLQLLVPRGWFPTVIPGTGRVTVGGAIASDIHGKFRYGSFSRYVESAMLATPALGEVEISAVTNPDIYWATSGGMGLTGLITEATLRLHPIETSMMRVDTQRCVNIDACMAAMLDESFGERYSVAWIDCLASGASLGRSVLERGEHATVDELPPSHRNEPLRYSNGIRIAAPPWAPSGLLNKWSMKAFNELWYRKSPRTLHRGITRIPAFFHLLDMVTGFNRIYGTRGFVQYQFVVPYGEEAVVRTILERLAATGCASFLAVLKRFETTSEGMLSFPMPGWTLALDIPVARAGLSELFDGFDRLVADAGGRVYLAKDARVSPEMFGAMYHRLDEWRDVRARVDPNRVMRSDLARRLGL